MKQLLRGLYYWMRWARVHNRVSRLRRSNSKLVFFMGTPAYSNIGDLAIAKAEIEFIKDVVGDSIVCVDAPTLQRYKDRISSLVGGDDTIVTIGGGNLGDTYPGEENIRRFVASQFIGNPVIIFPQTIYFSDTPEGEACKQESARIYGQHPNLTVIAREAISYEIARAVFSNNKTLLTPDIVLSVRGWSNSVKRSGVVTCLRADLEKTLSDNDRSRIMVFASSISSKIKNTDTMYDGRFIALRDKSKIVRNKLAEFSAAEIVITDRLHGMVFAAITGTPCIVFSNFNHKVKGTYEWIGDLDYIKYCESIDDLEGVNVENLIKSAKPYDPSQFNKYWDLIRAEIER